LFFRRPQCRTIRVTSLESVRPVSRASVRGVHKEPS